jgi:hypothetical protein
MPILGIIASAITGSLAGPNSYESIATVSVGSGGQANIEFTSIPATFTHLQIRGIARTTSGTSVDFRIRMNSDTGSNYARHSLRSGGASADAEGNASQVYMWLDRAIPGLANTFGGVVIDILDYANTNKYKTMRGLGGADRNGSGIVSLSSGLWMNTSTVTSLTITLESGNFAEYSSLALYGIKGV